MSKEKVDEVKEGEEAWIRETKTHIFIDEPYGCEAVEFYKVVFGAIELKRLYKNIETDDEIKGRVRVVSCELQLDSACYIISELTPNSSWHNKSRGRGKLVYVEDVHPVLALALQLGSALENQIFVGDCLTTAEIRDPFDIEWSICAACTMPEITAAAAEKDKHSPIPHEDFTLRGKFNIKKQRIL